MAIENFNPNRVQRGWRVESANAIHRYGKKAEYTVLASDYNKLLRLYRASLKTIEQLDRDVKYG